MNALPSSRSVLNVMLAGPRVWKRWWSALVRQIDHESILAKSVEEATSSFHFQFMVAIASGIATIGLLFNSPAVIIGAMLISPLMSPIVSLGLATARFDVGLGRQSARTLLSGSLIAVIFAAAIVWVSPIQELTPEIIARTRPNLFDLAVAMLSGFAGGYAMIRGRGGAIVGVAIATALMPPLAVVGYGLATWRLEVTRGAALLFVTNLAAIALTVAAIAVWYGFGRGTLRRLFARQALVTLIILIPLAIPLYISLKGIAWESKVNATVKAIIEQNVSEQDQGQVAKMNIRLNGYDRSLVVDAIVINKQYQPGLKEKIGTELRQALKVPVDLHFFQLRTGDTERLNVALADNLREEEAFRPADFAATLRARIPFPITAVQVEADRKTAVVVPSAQAAVGLAAWHDIERTLSDQYQDWHLVVVPPVTGLPSIMFATDADVLSERALAQLEAIAWALQRWGIHEVRLVGHASTDGNGPYALAKRRMDAVGKWFADHGIASVGEAIYPAPRQARQEREAGREAFRSVDVIVPANAPSVAAQVGQD